MKCPKCHYLSFDPEPRCRNCGYSLALEDSDLMMVGPDASGESPVDLTLRDRVDSPQGEPMRVPDGGGAATVVEPVAAAPSAGAPARAVPAAASGPQQAPRATPRGPFDSASRCRSTAER